MNQLMAGELCQKPVLTGKRQQVMKRGNVEFTDFLVGKQGDRITIRRITDI
jgi:hypothetical protein